MDPNSGRIYTPERIKKMQKAFEKFGMTNPVLERLIPMKEPPTQRQMARRPPKVGRNEPCPCGSGKKFKKCCLR